jgi:hypothetical protein
MDSFVSPRSELQGCKYVAVLDALKAVAKEDDHRGCDVYFCVDYASVHETFLRKAKAYTSRPGVDLENMSKSQQE